MDAGLFLARVVFGLLMAAHGSQKLLGWFGGPGLAGTAGMFEGLGFRPGSAFALAAAAGETSGGLLTAAGLFGPVGPALMVAVMIVAVVSVHWANGVFAASNGVELPLLYAAGGAALALTGAGAYSIDALIGLTPLWTPAVAGVALGVAIGSALFNLAIRRPAARAIAG